MQSLSLDGKWKIHWTDGQRGGMPYVLKDDLVGITDSSGKRIDICDDYDDIKWIDATVPGEVHLDLMQAGILEDPYIGSNVMHARWVEECIWYYRKTFDADAAASASHCTLVFEGLDYGAVIYLNGTKIAEHADTFYPCRINVTGLLKERGNLLIVMLESGLYSVSEKPINGYYTATDSIDNYLHKRIWMRKNQSTTAWDWSPRLINVGIVGSVHLDYSEDIVVAQTSVRALTQKDLSSAQVEVRVFTDFVAGQNIALELTVEGKVKTFMQEDLSCLSGRLELKNPRLWWPIGHGPQNLYQVEIRVLKEGKEIYSAARQFGIRHVEVDQSKMDDGQGRYFTICVNGRPIFVKGANFVPVDMITANATPERYNKLIDLALHSHFNMLRVWGGGIYETDYFYDLCDKKGILVWQEFICACSVLPYHDDSFAQKVRTEFTYQVRRLSEHPSLIVWCGNNESEQGVLDQRKGILAPDFVLYHRVLPEILTQEDREKYYQPTSPYSPDIGVDHWDFSQGDQHPWTVGFRDKDCRKYREMDCRFPNEGGVLGPVSLKTIKACFDPGKEEMYSFAWQVHDNMLENWQRGSSPDEVVKFWINRDPRRMNIEQYVYAGGMLQGEGLCEYINNFRRRKFISSAAIFWMYNDCWPCTRSWTIVDYYLNVTPSYYYVRRAFNPLSVVVVEHEQRIFVYGINDTITDFSGKIQLGIFTCQGQYLQNITTPVVIKENTSQIIGEIDRYLVYKEGLNKAIPFAVLYDDAGNLVARHRLIHVTYDKLELRDEPVKVENMDGNLIFKSSVFTMGVCIDLEGDSVCSDNMFDLYPDMEYVIAADVRQPVVQYTLNSLLHNTSEA